MITQQATNEEACDLLELLSRAVQELPEAQKEVIDLAFFKGMSQRQKANRLGDYENAAFIGIENAQLPNTYAEHDLRSVENRELKKTQRIANLEIRLAGYPTCFPEVRYSTIWCTGMSELSAV